MLSGCNCWPRFIDWDNSASTPLLIIEPLHFGAIRNRGHRKGSAFLLASDIIDKVGSLILVESSFSWRSLNFDISLSCSIRSISRSSHVVLLFQTGSSGFIFHCGGGRFLYQLRRVTSSKIFLPGNIGTLLELIAWLSCFVIDALVGGLLSCSLDVSVLDSVKALLAFEIGVFYFFNSFDSLIEYVTLTFFPLILTLVPTA